MGYFSFFKGDVKEETWFKKKNNLLITLAICNYGITLNTNIINIVSYTESQRGDILMIPSNGPYHSLKSRNQCRTRQLGANYHSLR